MNLVSIPYILRDFGLNDNIGIACVARRRGNFILSKLFFKVWHLTTNDVVLSGCNFSGPSPHRVIRAAWKRIYKQMYPPNIDANGSFARTFDFEARVPHISLLKMWDCLHKIPCQPQAARARVHACQ